MLKEHHTFVLCSPFVHIFKIAGVCIARSSEASDAQQRQMHFVYLEMCLYFI